MSMGQPPVPLILPEGTILNGTKGHQYVILKHITEGTQGISYTAKRTDRTDDRKYFIKTPYVDSRDFPEALQDRTSKIMASFTREYQNRNRLHGVKGVAPVLDIGFAFAELHSTDRISIPVPFLVQEFVPGETLDDYLRVKYPAPNGQFRGIPKYEDWADLARRILLVVKGVHNRNVVHGDIWPRNIVMTEDHEPTLVDLGSSFLLDLELQRRGGGVARHHYLAPERLDRSQTWYLPADIFSIGALLFYMACGEPPDYQVTHKDDLDQLKKHVISELNRLRPGFLRQNAGAANIIDKSLRHHSSDRFPYVESILEALDVFDSTQGSQSIAQSRQRIDVELRRLQSQIESLEESDSVIFMDYTARQVELLSRQVETMSRGTLELLGAREELLNSLLRFLAALGTGHKYLTVTVPAYWLPNNLGTNGRFLAMNKRMVQRGVTVKRVFLLCEEDKNDPETMAILAAHLEACRELEHEGVAVFNKDADPNSGQLIFYTGYRLVSPEVRESFISSGDQVAIWRGPDQGSTMSMNFSFVDSTIHNRDIRKIRFWSSPGQEPILQRIEQQIADSRPLTEFPGFADLRG